MCKFVVHSWFSLHANGDWWLCFGVAQSQWDDNAHLFLEHTNITEEERSDNKMVESSAELQKTTMVQQMRVDCGGVKERT